MDNTVVHGVFIDLTNIGVMGETSKGSNVAMADEVEPLIPDSVSKQSTTSNEATSWDKGEHDVIIVYSTSCSPTPLNYAQLTTIIHYQVQDMIGQAMDPITKRQQQENKQFCLSM